ncbi:hypothetical protein HZH66_003460 [Vespula vulgaris]|uniref:Uncharacterized protein n=1 Tax=Vespula vulgaris TaxID=7454 RepID=A0A834NDX9_VESVU|nr:hypothetical protein HZH66_003460 [Vespula vulgaris]
MHRNENRVDIVLDHRPIGLVETNRSKPWKTGGAYTISITLALTEALAIVPNDPEIKRNCISETCLSGSSPTLEPPNSVPFSEKSTLYSCLLPPTTSKSRLALTVLRTNLESAKVPV